MFIKAPFLAAFALVAGLVSAQPSPGPHVGDAVLYFPSLGACGVLNTSDDLVASVSSRIWDTFGHQPNPNDNPICGRQIQVSANGKSVRATVADKCFCGEDGNGVLLSTAAFRVLADPATQVIHGASWVFV